MISSSGEILETSAQSGELGRDLSERPGRRKRAIEFVERATQVIFPSQDVYQRFSQQIPVEKAIIAPHPDDETLNATLALRLKFQHDCLVYVLPFSFGTKLNRQSERLVELKNACKHLDFFLLPSEHLNEKNHMEIELAMLKVNPDLVIFPHAHDHHPTHIRCHHIAKDLCQYHNIKYILTEYWQPQHQPNLAIESSLHELTLMLEALICHTGEITRNPYHISFSARLMDQYRRASEVMQTSGQIAKIGLCEIYQAPHLKSDQLIKTQDSLSQLF
jgi:LmbE family N-acetylglucosaminyl deacetylase